MSTMPATSCMEITASRDSFKCNLAQHNLYKLLPGTVVHIDEWIVDGTIITFVDFSCCIPFCSESVINPATGLHIYQLY